MEVWAAIDQRIGVREAAERARRAEALGYTGLNVPDAVHDGLLVAQAALAATRTLRVATSVLVAFPRSPMNVAHAAWDLQSISGGRFELGLGSQVRGNIVGRYSTPWTAPVPRMREYIGALRAIFACWHSGEPLRFEGEHYRFTRMQPFFVPGPFSGGPPKIHLGAVGPAMTALAGEAADGLMCHPTNSSPRYLREVALPRIERGAARADREPGAVQLMVSELIATGADTAAVASAREKARETLGFLYSTPAYWPSLELYGWKAVGERLHAMTRAGEWQAMSGAITDEMLDALVPSAPYGEIAALLRERFAGLSARLPFPLPERPEDEPGARAAIEALRDH
jgi:probable F420-dependent oxidoreductase